MGSLAVFGSTCKCSFISVHWLAWLQHPEDPTESAVDPVQASLVSHKGEPVQFFWPDNSLLVHPRHFFCPVHCCYFDSIHTVQGVLGIWGLQVDLLCWNKGTLPQMFLVTPLTLLEIQCYPEGSQPLAFPCSLHPLAHSATVISVDFQSAQFVVDKCRHHTLCTFSKSKEERKWKTASYTAITLTLP